MYLIHQCNSYSSHAKAATLQMAEGPSVDQEDTFSSEDSFPDSELFLDTVINDEGEIENVLATKAPAKPNVRACLSLI